MRAMKRFNNLLVLGMGIQGTKRVGLLKSAGFKNIITVDPFKSADYKSINHINLKKISHALVCTPDQNKIELLDALAGVPNLLVEKPLGADYSLEKLIQLYDYSNQKGSSIYTSYNFRLEPSIAYLKKKLNTGQIGDIYQINMEYSNGTSALVNVSPWRNQTNGVIDDMLPHLLSIVNFLFPNIEISFVNADVRSIETDCYDYVETNLISKFTGLNLKSTYLSWKNKFYIEIIGKLGSYKIDSLQKWSKSTFTYARRKFPAGLPLEFKKEFKKGDLTFLKEHKNFLGSGIRTSAEDLKLNIFINNILNKILDKAT